MRLPQTRRAVISTHGLPVWRMLASLSMSLLDVISGGRCSTYAEVLVRLISLETEVGESDGLYWFTRLYREMTAAVAERATQGAFKDPEFLEALDCNFAELYFDAVRSFVRNDGATPRAWWPLFEARTSRRRAPLQFALGGVNAHINRDLPVALVTTYEEAGGAPTVGSERHEDYLAINAVLADVHARTKTFLITGALGQADVALGKVDDLLELFSLERARDGAWIAGEVRFALRGHEGLSAQHLASLDRFVGFAGRGILRPPPALPVAFALSR
jgi:hypothetical protein